MARIAIILIKSYQAVISPLLKQALGLQAVCRYTPTCSYFAILMITKYGIVKGSYYALRRVGSCQPWSHAYGTTL